MKNAPYRIDLFRLGVYSAVIGFCAAVWFTLAAAIF